MRIGSTWLNTSLNVRHLAIEINTARSSTPVLHLATFRLGSSTLASRAHRTAYYHNRTRTYKQGYPHPPRRHLNTMTTTTTTTAQPSTSTYPSNPSSTTSSRRESLISSTSASSDATITHDPSSSSTSPGANKGETIPPSEIVQAELTRARAGGIPNSFLTSLGAWWNSSEKTGKESETRLLKRIPYFRTDLEPDVAPTPSNPNPLTARITQVPLKSNSRSARGGRVINTCSFTTPETKGSKEAVVLTHGYGAGLGFFYRNLESMAETSASVGRAAYAIDWLGMGRSSRPDPKELVSGRKASAKERVEKAERFFTDSLDEWREKMGIEKMTLIGHSLGGYISTAYALKYPDRVDRLILLSPAGVPNHPEKGEDIVPDAEVMEGAMLDMTQDQTETTGAAPHSKPSVPPKRPGISSAPTEVSISRPGMSRESSAQSVDSANFEADKEAKKGNQGLWKRAVYYMWEEGVSPFGLVRKLGPIGPMMVAKYSTRRFAALPEEDIQDLHDYVWTTVSAKGSSEYAITHLLAPGAHARWPLADRVHKLNIPVCFSYGDHDWMDIKGGYDSVAAMRAAGNNHGKVIEISHAGHHVYLDNARKTNALIRSEILTAARRSRERAAAEAAQNGGA